MFDLALLDVDKVKLLVNVFVELWMLIIVIELSDPVIVTPSKTLLSPETNIVTEEFPEPVITRPPIVLFLPETMRIMVAFPLPVTEPPLN